MLSSTTEQIDAQFNDWADRCSVRTPRNIVNSAWLEAKWTDRKNWSYAIIRMTRLRVTRSLLYFTSWQKLDCQQGMDHDAPYANFTTGIFSTSAAGKILKKQKKKLWGPGPTPLRTSAIRRCTRYAKGLHTSFSYPNPTWRQIANRFCMWNHFVSFHLTPAQWTVYW